MRNYSEFIARKTRECPGEFDASDLNPAFIGHFNDGARVEVQFGYGEVRRGTIGVTTGWKPCFLLMGRISDFSSSDTIGLDDKVLRVIPQRRARK